MIWLSCGDPAADNTIDGSRGLCYRHGWQLVAPESMAPPPAPETLRHEKKTITVQCPHCQNLIEVIVDG